MKASILFFLLLIGTLTASGCTPGSDKPIKGFVIEQTVSTITTYQPMLSATAANNPPPTKKKSIVRSYFTEDAYRIDTQVDNKSTIYRFDNNKIIILDHDNRIYSFKEIPKDMSIDEDEVLFIINQTKKVSKVGIYECNSFRVTIRKPTKAIQNICMSDKVDVDYFIYRSIIRKLSNVYPEGASLIANILQYGDAFPVEIKSEMTGASMRQKSLTSLISAETVDIPHSRFEVPEGYSKN
jgi:Domain of unknown function (DUF4412)